MKKKHWILLIVLAALFVGLMAFGVRAGDVDVVKRNAELFCFS